MTHRVRMCGAPRLGWKYFSGISHFTGATSLRSCLRHNNNIFKLIQNMDKENDKLPRMQAFSSLPTQGRNTPLQPQEGHW